MTNLTFDYGWTGNLVNAGIVAGSSSTYSTTAATRSAIDGKFTTSLGIQTNAATPTTDATTGVAFNALAPNQCCSLVLGVNAAGAIQMCQGPILSTKTGVTTTVGEFLYAPQFPDLPDDFVPLGWTNVRTAPSAAAWTPGSSDWTASGVTALTFVNVVQLPKRPKTS